ncbi:type VII secretion target [Amycolatopsis sp. NPDC006125]|uniref:type VII secretion target n=1 Tax=Amycolatopsis sp. NPDC006125 TaxID=3156730 RepID=UPI0033AB7F7F
MSGGFSVDVGALRKTAAAAAAQTSQVSALQQQLQDANVPAVSWGLIGQPTVYPFYQDMVDQLRSHLTQMAEGYQAIGAKLAKAADMYSAMDDGVVAAFESIGEDLDEAGRGVGEVG